MRKCVTKEKKLVLLFILKFLFTGVNGITAHHNDDFCLTPITMMTFVNLSLVMVSVSTNTVLYHYICFYITQWLQASLHLPQKPFWLVSVLHSWRAILCIG